VVGPAGKTLEVQIRTEKCTATPSTAWPRIGSTREKPRASKQFEQKIAWLRELLAWRDEVADWSKARGARLDDTVYVLTPQGKVIDLPAAATPVDFA
jgi:GTP pyrophosphokinase